MTTVEEVMQLCRLCLVKDKVNVPIFEEDVEIRQILTKINTLLPVKVSRNDNLPKLICKDCSSKLDMLYMFRKTSVESDKQLHSWLSSGPKETKPEVSVKQENFESTESRIEDEQVDAAAFLMQQEFEELDESGLEQESVRKKFKRTPKSAVETDDEDFDEGMAAKPEDDDSDEMDQTDYAEDPSVGTDDEQPGPSGVVKEATETPWSILLIKEEFEDSEGATSSEEPLTKHSNEPNSKCSLCARIFNSLPDLITHVKAEHRQDGLLHPGYWFPSNENGIIVSKTGKFVCDFCGKTIKTWKYFKEHVHNHISAGYECTACGKKFPTKCRLDVHALVHSKEKPHLCTICNKSFGQNCTLTYHINTCHGAKTMCDLCGKQYAGMKKLNEHMARAHSSNRELFKCEECKKLFANKYYFTSHVKTHIKKPTTFICDLCGIHLSRNSSLKVHMARHKDEKMFSCNICDRKFFTNSALTSHLKTHSEREERKLFPCEVCKKLFAHNNTLQVHMRYHSSERPFKCETCGKGFIKNSYLRRHACKKEEK